VPASARRTLLDVSCCGGGAVEVRLRKRRPSFAFACLVSALMAGPLSLAIGVIGDTIARNGLQGGGTLIVAICDLCMRSWHGADMRFPAGLISLKADVKSAELSLY